ncbi:hypothetical protein G5B47_10395 [Paenibacillus sp. 7124]|uniref:Uncharacterized protein n=1 Tax=Paenibacillus apii TaxID=1850370 RepID=A0A6M1PKI8_9BACL|nr:hypothetical protein [Paenibacillus apii]NGM82822.1 hypothetical protein [Paenibacillus apii]NJJ39962.1 hypothetical protein [Paenibacillus apii]
MRGVAKAVLGVILSSVAILLLLNLAFFFPWYMTLISETYNVAQVVAGDNYMKELYYEDAMNRLRERPIFRDKEDKIEISVTNADGRSAIGDDDETIYYDRPESDKPYLQRGEPLEVEIKAVYPFTVTLWGEKLERELPVSFKLSTTGLKHYKDLNYYTD